MLAEASQPQQFGLREVLGAAPTLSPSGPVEVPKLAQLPPGFDFGASVLGLGKDLLAGKKPGRAIAKAAGSAAGGKAGAAIGTAIAPGVGTAIGAGLGNALGRQ